MLIATFIFSIFNTFMILLAGVIYFNKNYETLPKDVYNALVEVYEKAQQEEQASQELAGGCGVAVGFGADYLEDDTEEDE
ncbi:MAG: hypothetical protein NC218_08570 [Acetobacter sp.]|nr:hypothetical protein [Acetobacter sp.]